MNVFVEEKTLNDSDFDEIDEFSSIKKELQVFCGTADSNLNICVLSKEYGLILAISMWKSLFKSEVDDGKGAALSFIKPCKDRYYRLSWW